MKIALHKRINLIDSERDNITMLEKDIKENIKHAFLGYCKPEQMHI